MTQPALVGGHLVLRTATGEAEIDHLRETLNEGRYLMAGRPAGLAPALNAWLTENSAPRRKSTNQTTALEQFHPSHRNF